MARHHARVGSRAVLRPLVPRSTPAAPAALLCGLAVALGWVTPLAAAAPVRSGPLEAGADGAGTLRFRQAGGPTVRQSPGSLRFRTPAGW
jgi:hypothetical protein